MKMVTVLDFTSFCQFDISVGSMIDNNASVKQVKSIKSTQE